jgi:hypothetical protein
MLWLELGSFELTLLLTWTFWTDLGEGIFAQGLKGMGKRWDLGSPAIAALSALIVHWAIKPEVIRTSLNMHGCGPVLSM